MAVTRAYLPIEPFSPGPHARGQLWVAEKASQTFKRGTPIIITSGFGLTASAGPSTIWGIAAEDAHNGATDGLYQIGYWTIAPGDLWYVSLKQALAQTDIGGNYGLVLDATTGFWYADTADTNDQVTVRGYPSGPGGTAIGDLQSRVIVSIDSANIAGI